MKRFKYIVIAAFCILLVYAVSYTSLSIQGRYEPLFIGLNGVKGYGWAPRGFVRDFVWSRWCFKVYFPAWYADNMLWHSPEAVSSGKYPVDEVKQEDIGKVDKAWSHK